MAAASELTHAKIFGSPLTSACTMSSKSCCFLLLNVGGCFSCPQQICHIFPIQFFFPTFLKASSRCLGKEKFAGSQCTQCPWHRLLY